MPKTREQQALDSVVGPTGRTYTPADTVEAIDRHLVAISDQIKVAAGRAPESCRGLRADQDQLLARRDLLLAVEQGIALNAPDEAQA